jgi:serine/threonine protein kinase
LTSSDDDFARDTLVDAKKTQLGVGKNKPKRTDAERAKDLALVGTMLGPYLVGAELGGGAMGVVYRATHIDTNRVVALKVMRPQLLEEPTTVARFRRESRIASRLGHPHVGGVIELVESDGRYAMALDFVDGEPLSAIMTMPLPPERVTTIVGQLLRGLEHAHAMGLVHRDLKPDNVLVEWRNNRDHARIIDFGIAIAKFGSDDSVERITEAGLVVGTPMYMAPEQARGEQVDHRADLYSLGMIVYEMLSGVAAYEGKALDVLTAKLKRDVPRIEDRVPGLVVEPLLERFCRKLVTRDREKRFSSARHALIVLDMITNDRAAAGAALGIMDVEKALAVVSLPSPPPARRRP